MNVNNMKQKKSYFKQRSYKYSNVLFAITDNDHPKETLEVLLLFCVI